MNYMAHIVVKEDEQIIDDIFLFGEDKTELLKTVDEFIDAEKDEKRECSGIFSIKLEDGEDTLPDDTVVDDGQQGDS